MTGHGDERVAALEARVARLQAALDEARGGVRVPSRRERDGKEPRRGFVDRRVVLFTPDGEGWRRGKDEPTLTDLAWGVVESLQQQMPGVEWSAESRLENVPAGALCAHYGDMVMAMSGRPGWGRNPPIHYRVDEDEAGVLVLRRARLTSDPEVREFEALRMRMHDAFDDLLLEAETAKAAHAEHHAQWCLLALESVLHRIRGVTLLFDSGGDEWRDHLGWERPEFLPAGTPVAIDATDLSG